MRELLDDLMRRDRSLTDLIAKSLDLSIQKERLMAKREGLRIAIDLVKQEIKRQ